MPGTGRSGSRPVDQPPGRAGKTGKGPPARVWRLGRAGATRKARRGPSVLSRTGKGPVDTGKGPGGLTAASGKSLDKGRRASAASTAAQEVAVPSTLLVHPSVAAFTEVRTGRRAPRPDGPTKAEHWPSSSLPRPLNGERALLRDSEPGRRLMRVWAAPSRDRAGLSEPLEVDGLHAASGRRGDAVALTTWLLLTPPRPASPGSAVASTSQSPAQRARAGFPIALHASRRPRPPTALGTSPRGQSAP